MEAGEHLFALMTNYQPFRIGAEEAGETLFDLTVGSVPTEGEKTHVFTDTSDDDMPRIEVYRMATDWLFQVAMYKTADVACRLRVTEDMHLARLEMEDESTRFGIDNACMLLYAFTTAKRHTLEMHAAVVVRPGETEDLGYLFLGKSGTGKSTHACMWMDAFGCGVSSVIATSSSPGCSDDDAVMETIAASAVSSPAETVSLVVTTTASRP